MTEELQLLKDREDTLLLCEEKILSALGLARNAGALAIGADAVEIALRSGKARLVFLAKNLSANSSEKILRLISSTGTKYMILPSSTETVAKRLGKTGLVGLCALTKPGFDKIIFKAIRDNENSLDNTTEVQ